MTDSATPSAVNRRGQSGVALLEYLVAFLILTLTVGGVVTATVGAGRIGQQGDRAARMNVVMTAFAEAVKALPYELCAEAESYDSAFDSSQGQLPESERLEVTSGADLEVTAVQVDDDCDPNLESGLQTVTLEIQKDGRTLERQIVKRRDDISARPLDFRIKDPTAVGNEHLVLPAFAAPVFAWLLQAEGESQIFQYEWWCDGKWAAEGEPAPTPDFVTASPVDSSAYCGPLVARQGDPAIPDDPADLTDDDYVYLALRVTEAGTGRVGETYIRVLRPKFAVAENTPVARIDITAPDQKCLSTDPCILGPDQTVEVFFASVGPEPPDGRIVQWEWDFGDGTPNTVCSASSADPFGNLCKFVSHRFEGGGNYSVRLKVTGDLGLDSEWFTRNVYVDGIPVVKPTIANQEGVGGLTASPTVGIASATMPLRVTFDASGSHADGSTPGVGSPPGGIVEYTWDFDVNDANTAPDLVTTDPMPTFDYYNTTPTVRNVRARVTVRDINNFTMSAEIDIAVYPFGIPPTFTNTRAVADCPWGLGLLVCGRARNGYFDFQWVNVPRAPGDTMQIQIEMSPSTGWLCNAIGVFNTSSRTYTAGTPGSSQSIRYGFSSSPAGYNGICGGIGSDGYRYRVQMHLTNANGTFASGWSPYLKTRAPEL